MLRYRDKIELPPELTLRDAEEIEELLRGVGRVERNGRDIVFTLYEYEDLWDVCERVYEIAADLASRGVQYVPERSYVEEVPE